MSPDPDEPTPEEHEGGGEPTPDEAAPAVPPAPPGPPTPPTPDEAPPPVPAAAETPPAVPPPPPVPQGPVASPYGPPAYGAPGTPGDPAAGSERPGLSTGAGIGIGVGIGCGAHVVAFILLLATLMLGGMFGSTLIGIIWPFVVVAVVAIVMLFWKRTRGIAIGMLIVAAAAWIVVLGPCLGIMGV
ncbi:hypothetical protein [Agromyces sp. NPDC058064]|uniref:hypothetical protein n=1 Tax=Agromyces sp. NPDC058064 TaxID=3346322 RepID=UPI0036D9E72C